MIFINNYVTKKQIHEIIKRLQVLDNIKVNINNETIKIKELNKLNKFNITKETIGLLLKSNIKSLKIYNTDKLNTLLVIDNNKNNTDIYIKIEKIPN
ncbi:MAG: hypothetical protein FH751_09210 [Firmicutes bacterium]|nr:hypothetical protein [Bacillota bacterium]